MASKLTYFFNKLIVFNYSAAKAPFLARFKVRRCGVAELEAVGLLKGNKAPPPSTNMGSEYWQACIFKVGDDVRQVSTISTH